MTRRSNGVTAKTSFKFSCFIIPAAIFVTTPRASADILGAGDGTIYRLNNASTFEEGCFPPCLCPITIQTGLKGTFKVAHSGNQNGIDVYKVDDVHWTVPLFGEERRIVGSGVYDIGSPDPITVLQHRMRLDLKIGDEPVQHFDSGWLPLEVFPDIKITVSMHGMYCWDIAITIDASPVPENVIRRYSLVDGSTFQRGCYDPCDCPLGPEIPMRGTFGLVPLSEDPSYSEYAVVNVDWNVLASSVNEVFPIKGCGKYLIHAEFVVQHRMGLHLSIGGEERAHFDSGLVIGGSEFPRIDIVVSMNGMECYDTVLHVVAEPSQEEVCGGFAGIPCPEGEFCKLPVGHCCCDFFGICTPIPAACPDVWAPVCGCDGVTYGNECEADAAGMSIEHFGACRQECFTDSDCPAASQFCKFPPGTCGDGDVQGLCTERPNACPAIYAPVCGCDGVTYGNECEADAAGVSVRHHGECPGPACAAERVLSEPDYSYCPGTTNKVRILLNPPAGTSAVGIEDTPPAGWAVSNISEGGSYDAVNNKVKWGPLFPPLPAEVGYDVTPTATSGMMCFSGSISIDGVNEPICGDACLDACCPDMEADAPQAPCANCPVGDCNACAVCGDGQVELCEVIGYACAWMQGCNDDLAGMTRAAFVWRNGECYCWSRPDDNWFPTECPGPASGCCANNRGVDAAGSGSEGSAAVPTALGRVRPVIGGRDESLRGGRLVSIEVDAPAGTSAMALEVELPAGWQALGISDGGQWDAVNRKIKWGPYFQDLSRTVSFKASPLREAIRKKSRRRDLTSPNDFTLTGTVSFDGVNHPITVE